MEEINRLIDGMNSDVHPSMQPANTTRYSLNFTPLSKDGNMYSVTNESGTVLFSEVSFPAGFKVIGYRVLNIDIIVVLADNLGHSQVGYIREDGSPHNDYGFYHPVAPANPDGTVPVDNSELGFKVTHPVSCRARKTIDSHRILYYTDNLNPFGRIDLDNPPKVGEAKETARLVFDQSIPRIGLKEIKEGVQGSIKPGVYSFVTRYVTENGGFTSFGLPCNFIPMVPSERSAGVNAYHGQFYNDSEINKNIVLKISNIDTKYRELQIIAISYNETGVFQSSVVSSIPITSDTIEYTFTGATIEDVKITREELIDVPIAYNRAKCIEQKDNTLFLSNLSEAIEESDTLQEIANNVKVSYEIEEVAYCNREESGSASSTGFYKQTGPIISEADKVFIRMSKNVESPSLTDFELRRNDSKGFATLSITTFATVAAGTTITLESAGAGDITFTGETSPGTGADDTFLAVTSNLDSTVNLINAINNHPDNVNYAAVLNGSNLKLYWIGTGTGNGKNITVVGGGTSGSTTISGGSTSATLINPTAVSISGNIITLTFGVDVLTTEDELYIGDIFSDSGEVYTTGSDADSNKNYENLTEDTTSTATTPESFSSTFTDYIDERFTFEKKTYRRDEVYSLGFFLLYKDGTTSFVYHIPGNDKTDIGSVSSITGIPVTEGKNPSPSPIGNTGNTSGLLGTYVSTAEYPLIQSFPGPEEGDSTPLDVIDLQPKPRSDRRVLHHVMPSTAQEPHYRVSGTTTYIRLISLKFEFLQSIPTDILSNVAEIIFVRERRNSETNKSIFAQGIVGKLVESADHFDDNGNVTGTLEGNVKYDYNLMEMPFFNHFRAIVKTSANLQKEGDAQAGTQKGIAYPGASDVGDGSPTYAEGTKRNTDIRHNRCIFRSPETILQTSYKPAAEILAAGKLNPILKIKGKAKVLNFMAEVWKGAAGKDWMNNWAYIDMFCNYKEYELPDVGARSILAAQYVDPGKRRNTALLPDTNDPNRLCTRWNPGGLELKMDDDLQDGSGMPLTWFNTAVVWDKNKLCFDSYCKNSNTNVGEFCKGVPIPGPDPNNYTAGDRLAVGSETDVVNYLYNLEIPNARQYGDLTQAKFIPLERFDPGQTIFIREYAGVYSGDTFITKFSYNTSNILTKYPYHRRLGKAVHRPHYAENETETFSRRDYFHIDGAGPDPDRPNTAEGFDFREAAYFFVESDINTYYRHKPSNLDTQDYFPNNPKASDMLSKFYGYLGNISAYNGLYSYENDTKEFFIKGSTQVIVTRFENRTIYSEQNPEDSVIDAYRIFPVNNYYDLPSHTGPIWNSFVENDSLYLHTPKSLWRTFAEPAATLQGNISDVVLGTGSLFARPSREVTTTEGGFAGTISQHAGTHTQIGYIFPDLLQGKVFCLAQGKEGTFLKEISQDGMSTYFHKNLGEGIISQDGKFSLGNITTDNAHLIDNPFMGIGCLGGYDYKLRRYFLVKRGTSPFSITYSMINESWDSFHSYYPSAIISFDNRVLFVRNQDNADLWEMNIGEKGSFFGTMYESVVETVCAAGPSKTFNNIAILSDSDEGVRVRDDAFSTLQVYNDNQNSGTVSLISGNDFDTEPVQGQTLIKYRNGEYRIAIPRDSVVDRTSPIFSPNNIYVPQGGMVPIDDAYWERERIKGNWACFRYTYNNVPGRQFVLRGIKTIFEPNYR